MTRETKVGLLAGMAIILLIGIIVSDYLVVPQSPMPAQIQQFATQTQDNIHPPRLVAVPVVGDLPTAAHVDDVPTVPTPPEADARASQPRPAPTGHAPGFDAGRAGPTLGPGVVSLAPAAGARQAPAQPSPDVAHLQGLLDEAAGSPKTSTTVTVQEGDTLYKLAAEHLGSAGRFKELFEANRDQLQTADQLKVGMKLKLPAQQAQVEQQPVAGAAPVAAPAPSAAAPAAPAQAPRAVSTGYAVRANDTLYSIAQAKLGSGGRWHEIYDLNRQALGENEDNLRVGQTLKLPAR